MKFFIPIIFVTLAVGVTTVFTLPAYSETQVLLAKKAELTTALQNAKESEALFNEMERTYNTISEDDRMRLEKIVPSHNDAVRLILYIYNVARVSGITITEVSVATDTNDSPELLEGDESLYDTADLSFTITGSYAQLLQFLSELEQSLRILDITNLSFNTEEGGSIDYKVSVRTYWKR